MKTLTEQRLAQRQIAVVDDLKKAQASLRHLISLDDLSYVQRASAHDALNRVDKALHDMGANPDGWPWPEKVG